MFRSSVALSRRSRLPLATALLACALLLASAAHAFAQDAPATAAADSSGDWTYTVQPYFLAPSMSGTTGIGDLSSDVDADAGDILGALDFGAMLYLEMQDAQWAFALDGTYMNLGARGTTRLGEAGLDLRQTGIMGAAYRRLAPWAEAQLALVYNHMEVAFATTGPALIDRRVTEDWIDPYVGMRLTAPGTRKWRLAFTGSVGGFGIGSDFAWQAFPEVGYRFSRTFELEGGYRAISMDYANEDASPAFAYDVTTSGPQMGLRFRF